MTQEVWNPREAWADFWMFGLPIHTRSMGFLFYFFFFAIWYDYINWEEDIEPGGEEAEDFVEDDYWDFVNYEAYASGLNVTDLSEDWDLAPQVLTDDNEHSQSSYYHEDLFEDWAVGLHNHDDEQFEGEEDDFQVDDGYEGPDLVTEWNLDDEVDAIFFNFKYSPN